MQTQYRLRDLLWFCDNFQRLMDVNFLGSVYAARAVVKAMKEQKKGRIVFVSSQAGQLGLFGFTAYSASKFALRGLAEALQMEVSLEMF
jgi:3-dehydrosphinganine reductase